MIWKRIDKFFFCICVKIYIKICFFLLIRTYPKTQTFIIHLTYCSTIKKKKRKKKTSWVVHDSLKWGKHVWQIPVVYIGNEQLLSTPGVDFTKLYDTYYFHRILSCQPILTLRLHILDLWCIITFSCKKSYSLERSIGYVKSIYGVSHKIPILRCVVNVGEIISGNGKISCIFLKIYELAMT